MPWLITHEIMHSIVYFALTSLVFVIFHKSLPFKKNIKYFLIGYVVTILMDLDHLIDYFYFKKTLAFNLTEFLSGLYFGQTQKAFIPLHAWEWVIALLVSYFLANRRYGVVLFLALGIAAQLIYDTYDYGSNWYAYFISVRYLLGFSNLIFHM